jgi:NAD(P)-dependent dehydrogenase (short-subunit alcohol dehydrogenase family)
METCRQLASRGLRVVLTARNEARGLEAVEAIRRAGGDSDVVFHQLDVTDPSSAARLADFVRDHFRRLDILVRLPVFLNFAPSSDLGNWGLTLFTDQARYPFCFASLLVNGTWYGHV